MRKILFSGAAALALALVCLTPGASQASWLSQALHPTVVAPAYSYGYPAYYGPSYVYPYNYGGVYVYPRHYNWYGPRYGGWHNHGHVYHHGGGHHHR